MTKKLLTVCMALVAIAALAIPAAASASPVLTDGGVAIGTGKAIEGIQLGNSQFTSTDGTKTQLECSNGQMVGEVTKNSNNEIEGKITSAVFGGTGAQATGEPKPECTGESAFGNASVTAVVSEKAPWCIRSTAAMPANTFQVSGGACPGGSTVKFKMVTTLAGTCEYESTGAIGGTYNTGGTFAELKVTNTAHTSGATENGFKLISGSFLCPTSGSLDMSFTLRTSGTTQDLTIS